MDFTIQVQENAAIADDGDGFGLQGRAGRASSKASKSKCQMAEMAVGLSDVGNSEWSMTMLVH